MERSELGRRLFGGPAQFGAKKIAGGTPALR